jgi:hypothetical protein
MEQFTLQNHLHIAEEVGEIIKILWVTIGNNSGTHSIRRSTKTRPRAITGDLFVPVA